MARKYLQGRFTPKNPQKYMGDYTNIIYRSSWELITFRKVDEEPGIKKWCSEEFAINYIGIDDKPHRYFVDLAIITNSGRKFIIEIKPEAQTKPPNRGRGAKKESTFLNECVAYQTNQLKWAAARKWAEENGFEFMVWTEKDLGIK